MSKRDGFTPGPWFYRRGDEWSHTVVTHHGFLPDGSINTWVVASLNKQREPEHEANARLIAVAPDLFHLAKRLAALREALENGNSSAEFEVCKLAEQAQALVAMVEGVSK